MSQIFFAEWRVVKVREGRKQNVRHFIYCSRRRERAKGEFIRG